MSSVAISPIAWTEVAPPDATRWAIGFGSGNGGRIMVWFEPQLVAPQGIVIPDGTTFELKYKDYGTLVQGSWFALDIAGINVCMVYEVGIVARTLTADATVTTEAD